jgi:hypothetical protein
MLALIDSDGFKDYDGKTLFRQARQPPGPGKKQRIGKGGPSGGRTHTTAKPSLLVLGPISA